MPDTNFRLTCPACHYELMPGNSHEDDGFLVCDECDEIGVKVWLCSCGEEQHAGEEACISCLADSVTRCPADLDMYSAETVKAIAAELAGRQSGMLTRRQAA